MYNKHNKTIIEASEQDEVYIVKYIVKSFNEFVSIFIMYTSHSEIVFSVIALNASSYIQTYKHDLMINFLDIDTASLNKKIKTYKL